jgi:hypothetical protein
MKDLGVGLIKWLTMCAAAASVIRMGELSLDLAPQYELNAQFLLTDLETTLGNNSATFDA